MYDVCTDKCIEANEYINNLADINYFSIWDYNKFNDYEYTIIIQEMRFKDECKFSIVFLGLLLPLLILYLINEGIADKVYYNVIFKTESITYYYNNI